ncbi:MAG: preprotein translocase subunit SecA [Elusimicrobia bacterium]|nr:preprotein translocase subunit SecA [Elusimicrobiota bacterium]
MIKSLLNKIFGTYSDKQVKKLESILEQINSLEETIKLLSDEELKLKRSEFMKRHSQGESLESLMPEAFAVAREASFRTLGMRHFDVQIIGGAVLFGGNIAEMSTGEGKTLVAVLPVYLQSIAGTHVHVVTVNDYLAKRDAEWMGPAYEALGLKVGFIQSGMEHEERKAGYACDVVYITNNEIGFDYLRDNMAISPEHQVQGKLEYAIIDEVDSVLIDEARTPLIISGPSGKSSDKYYKCDKVIPSTKLKIFDNYEEEQQYKIKKFNTTQDIDEGNLLDALDEDKFHGKIVRKDRSISLTASGQQHLERALGIELYTEDNEFKNFETGEWQHHINQAIRAHYFFTKDVDYVVKDGQVIIVDEFTGRLMPGRRWSDGLHQAVEAKEGLKIKRENQTLATITFQNFFKLYEKLAGMTGTAMTEQGEFHKIYNLPVVEIPTNRPLARKQDPDAVYLSQKAKYDAVVETVKELNEKGVPVLVGTRSIEVSEDLSKLLKRRGVKHNILNAKHHLREAEIVSQAGRAKAVTISTNMAGRGTDIVLGGNPEYLTREDMERKGYDHKLIIKAASKSPAETDEEKEAKKEYERLLEKYKKITDEEHNKVIEAGGLHVLGTERHESRRVDNQLRGRCGRQGDPGYSKFFVALDDELMRLFGGDRIIGMMDKLGGMEEDEKIEHTLISRAISNSQKRVEGMNFDIRKQLLEYDDVMDMQRKTIYHHRNRILRGENVEEEILGFIEDYTEILLDEFIPPKTHPEEWPTSKISDEILNSLGFRIQIKNEDFQLSGYEGLRSHIEDNLKEKLESRKKSLGEKEFEHIARMILLQIIDTRWKDHLYELDQLKEGVSFRAYGQKDPLVEYKRESYHAFAEMMDNLKKEVTVYLFRASGNIINARLTGYREERATREVPTLPIGPGLGRERASTPGKTTVQQRIVDNKTGKNQPCPCGSGKKYRHCCG